MILFWDNYTDAVVRNGFKFLGLVEAFMFMFLCESKSSFLWGKCSGVQFLGYTRGAC